MRDGFTLGIQKPGQPRPWQVRAVFKLLWFGVEWRETMRALLRPQFGWCCVCLRKDCAGSAPGELRALRCEHDEVFEIVSDPSPVVMPW